MKTKHLLFSLLGICLFLACEQTSEGLDTGTDKGDDNPVISKSVNSGSFEKKNIELVSNYGLQLVKSAYFNLIMS